MDSRKRKALMNDGLEYVVYISEDGCTCPVYTDDEEDAMFLGLRHLEGSTLYALSGVLTGVTKQEVGVLV
jgi:hypothetical protein